MNKNNFYRLADGRLWDVQNACWLESALFINANKSAQPLAESTFLCSAEGRSDERYLAETLLSLNYPLGELALLCQEGIRQKLAELDAEYLTPRTLAGLANNDPVALERWQEHERLATPLREKLGELQET